MRNCPGGRLPATALLVAPFLFSCSPSADTSAIPSSAFVAEPSSILTVGDVIRVTFAGAPEFDQSQKIQPDGRVSLPTIGNIKASGRSITSLQETLKSLYKPHLNDPTVVVSIEQPAAAVYVSGEVGKPGKIPLDRAMTAFEAVMETGGFSKLANPKQVYIIRNQRGNQKRYTLNMNDTLSGYDSKPFYLRPYDIVYVKRSNW